jgi:hypothetical protein
MILTPDQKEALELAINLLLDEIYSSKKADDITKLLDRHGLTLVETSLNLHVRSNVPDLSTQLSDTEFLHNCHIVPDVTVNADSKPVGASPKPRWPFWSRRHHGGAQ